LDYQKFSFSSDFLPSWLTLDSSSGLLTGVVPSEFSGTLEVDLSVFDTIESSNINILITQDSSIVVEHQELYFQSQDSNSDNGDGSGDSGNDDSDEGSDLSESGGILSYTLIFLLTFIYLKKSTILRLER